MENYNWKDKSVEEIENGIILPGYNRLGGVLTQDGELVSNSLFSDGKTVLWGGAYDIKESEIVFRDEEVVFIGQLQKHWGNFLFDCTARLWYVLESATKRTLAYCSMDFEKEAFTNESGYQSFLDMIGIDSKSMMCIEKPTRFRKVIVPSLSGFPGQFYTDKYLCVFEKMIETAKYQQKWECYDKLYFTRRKMPNCKEIGEERIERFFERNGYKVIAPETLPLAEQVYLVSHCKSLVSIEGTTSHNILFAMEGTSHIILRKQNYVNTRQIWFDKIKGITPVYIDVFREPYKQFPINHDAGPFWVGITKSFKNWMKELDVEFMEPGQNYLKGIREFIIYTMKCVYYKYWLKY